MILSRRRDARLEDFKPQIFAERPHFDDEPAGEPRAHAVVEAFRSVGGRSAAITTWRPASISALSVWQNSACVDLPCRNCRSSITSTSMPRSASLKASAVWVRSAETKPYMNFSAVR
jgi:hypothetical protein